MILNKIYSLDEQIKIKLYIPNLDFEKALSDDEVDDFDESLYEVLQKKGIGYKDELNEIGLFFESMMDKLRDYEDKHS